MIKVSSDYEDFSSANEMKASMRMEAQEYDLDSFFSVDSDNNITINSEEETLQYGEYDEVYDDILECERFFKTRAGKLLISRLSAVKQSKIDDFTTALPHELLKVQAEFNAWDYVLSAVKNLEAEKQHINDLMKQ